MDEIERVKDTVRAYVEGVVDFDFTKGENAWHPEGLKLSYNRENQKLTGYTISQTRPNLSQDDIEVMKTKVSQKGTILFADRSGDAATVKLEWHYEKDGDRREITDYILLLRIEDEWKIVAKVYDE
ncbi:MAG: nuclear transport factor 2 family protein [Candidatus Thorarchaeota archaeon]